MRDQPVPANYRGRDQMTLEEFVADVEQCHFRTPYDTGANPNAMMVWNMVRNFAGMQAIEEDDLIEKYHVKEKGMTLEEGRNDVRRMRELSRNQLYPTAPSA